MKFYLKPNIGPETLFAVLDSVGEPVYTVKAENSALGCHFLLLDGDEIAAAKISCIRISSAFQYSLTAGKKHARVTVDYTAVKQPVKIKGVRWQFRGSVLTRSFDIVDENTRVVMTHGRCWNENGDCYAAEISEQECKNKELCLCIALAVDCANMGGIAAPIPAG